jgi:predicted phosphohydrolase
MTIQYASDLHLEFRENEFYIKNQPLLPGADILLLGGDIVMFTEMPRYNWFFDYVSENFGTAYWIAGNHEYYHYDLMKKHGAFKETIRDNVFLVNDFAVTHENVRLIMSTLWTQISPRNQIAIAKRMNDFHLIRYNGDRLTAMDLETEHLQSLKFIEQELFEEQTGLMTIVMTHHVPTFLHYPPEYFGDQLNEAFAVELKELIRNTNPDYWIYGHHHKNIEPFKIGKTTLLTNQLGYLRAQEHLQFDSAKKIVINTSNQLI